MLSTDWRARNNRRTLVRELACSDALPNKGIMRYIETCERQHSVRVAIFSEFLNERRTNIIKIPEHRHRR